MYNLFKEEIRKLAEDFNKKKYNLIRIVSHNDCDGVCAGAILAETFKRKNIKFSLSNIKRLSLELLKEIGNENWDLLVFSDLGSSNLKDIKEISKGRDVIIFDHHLVEEKVEGLKLINPQVFGISDYNEISGAGVCYLFSKNFGNLDLAYLGLMGALGDIQGEKGFIGLNKEIISDAISSGKVETKNGLRIFGYQTKPLHKILEYSTDPYIPGITGNETEAIHFLEDLGIKYRDGNKILKLIDLDKEDLKKLVSGIILKRLNSEQNPEDVFGEIYLLKDEEEGSPTKDMKEFSTLLNACGRMGKPSIGIHACLNKDKTKALNLLREYKDELIKSMNWFNTVKNSNLIVKGDNFCIVNAHDNVSDSLIGVLTSMVAKSNLYNEGTVLVFMANSKDGYIKFSGRIVGKKDINLREFFSGAKEIGAEIGGHKSAAGGFIGKEKEKDLLNFLERKFK